jgi:DNA-binding beta-propeller fold protein YncE
VAGYCNGTANGSSTALVGPWGIYISQSDGTLYVADADGVKIQAFSLFSRTGFTLPFAGLVYPYDVFVDSSNTIYVADYSAAGGTVFIQRNGINLRSIPAAGQSTSYCYLTGLYTSYSAVADRSGNIYVSIPYCGIVVKWAPNATIGVLVAGQLDTFGSGSNAFNWNRFIHLDEDRGALYVTDSRNQRVQRFIIGGNGTGVTVAGGHGPGIALNQLNDPSAVWVTSDGQTLYVADYGNNRIMKWAIGATQGSFVVGSVSGTAGSTSQLLHGPSDVALDPSETYLYIADYYNARVQRFRLQ